MHRTNPPMSSGSPSAARPLRAAVALLVVAASSALVAASLLRVQQAAAADTASSEGLLLAAAWWCAALLSAWFAGSLVVSSVARGAGWLHAARWLDVATLPVVRRLLDRVLAVTLVTGAMVPIAAHA